MKRFYKNRRFINPRKTPLYTYFVNTGLNINAGGRSSIPQSAQSNKSRRNTYQSNPGLD